MTKSEFVDRVADSSGLSKKDAATAVDAVIKSIEDALKSGEDVTFTGFGKFHVAAARRPRGPQPAHRRDDADRREPRAALHRGLRPQEGDQLAGRRATLCRSPAKRRPSRPFGDRLAAAVEERAVPGRARHRPRSRALVVAGGGRGGRVPGRAVRCARERRAHRGARPPRYRGRRSRSPPGADASTAGEETAGRRSPPASSGISLAADDAPDRLAAAADVLAHCLAVIDAAGPACVAVKPQLACFERLGFAGWLALEQTCAHARRPACWCWPTASAATSPSRPRPTGRRSSVPRPRRTALRRACGPTR